MAKKEPVEEPKEIEVAESAGGKTAQNRAFQSRVLMHQAAFLEAYAKCGTISGAAEAADVARRQHTEWMSKDPSYPERFDEASSRYVDQLVQAAVRRGIGLEIPIFDRQGTIIGYKFEASDSLLAMLIRRNDQSYRDKFTGEISVGRRDEYDAKKMARLTSTVEGRNLIRQHVAIEQRISELMEAGEEGNGND